MTGTINRYDNMAIPTETGIVSIHNSVLPGTTFPTNGQATHSSNKRIQQPGPLSFDGPVIHGKHTTVSVYEPAQLAQAPSIPALYHLINRAFSESHAGCGALPASLDRLDSPAQYLSQIGNDPGTFVYIITWVGTDEPIATAGAHRYVTPVVVSDVGSGEQGTTFKRVQLPKASGAEVETWELKLMAVDLALQGQGLASYLMALVDEEVKRRFKASVLAESANGQTRATPQLHLVLTTLKECNETFYARRGYINDYEDAHGPGFLGSPTGFSVLHMSKVLDV